MAEDDFCNSGSKDFSMSACYYKMFQNYIRNSNEVEAQMYKRVAQQFYLGTLLQNSSFNRMRDFYLLCNLNGGMVRSSGMDIDNGEQQQDFSSEGGNKDGRMYKFAWKKDNVMSSYFKMHREFFRDKGPDFSNWHINLFLLYPDALRPTNKNSADFFNKAHIQNYKQIYLHLANETEEALSYFFIEKAHNNLFNFYAQMYIQGTELIEFTQYGPQGQNKIVAPKYRDERWNAMGDNDDNKRILNIELMAESGNVIMFDKLLYQEFQRYFVNYDNVMLLRSSLCDYLYALVRGDSNAFFPNFSAGNYNFTFTPALVLDDKDIVGATYDAVDKLMNLGPGGGNNNTTAQRRQRQRAVEDIRNTKIIVANLEKANKITGKQQIAKEKFSTASASEATRKRWKGILPTEAEFTKLYQDTVAEFGKIVAQIKALYESRRKEFHGDDNTPQRIKDLYRLQKFVSSQLTADNIRRYFIFTSVTGRDMREYYWYVALSCRNSFEYLFAKNLLKFLEAKRDAYDEESVGTLDFAVIQKHVQKKFAPCCEVRESEQQRRRRGGGGGACALFTSEDNRNRWKSPHHNYQISLLPQQKFLTNYFKPSYFKYLKGILVWWDVGNGKSGGALSAVAHNWEKPPMAGEDQMPWTVIFVTKRSLKKVVLEELFHMHFDPNLNKAMVTYAKKLGIRDIDNIKPAQYMDLFNKIVAGGLWNGGNFQGNSGVKGEPATARDFEFRVLSYAQFAHFCSNFMPRMDPATGNFRFDRQTSRYAHLIKSREDPLRRTLVVFDEVQYLYNESSASGLEQYKHISDMIIRSYQVSKNNSCRLMGLSATPFVSSTSSKTFLAFMHLVTFENNRATLPHPADSHKFEQNFFHNAVRQNDLHGDPKVLEYKSIIRGSVTYFKGSNQKKYFPIPSNYTEYKHRSPKIGSIFIPCAVSMKQKEDIWKAVYGGNREYGFGAKIDGAYMYYTNRNAKKSKKGVDKKPQKKVYTMQQKYGRIYKYGEAIPEPNEITQQTVLSIDEDDMYNALFGGGGGAKKKSNRAAAAAAAGGENDSEDGDEDALGLGDNTDGYRYGYEKGKATPGNGENGSRKTLLTKSKEEEAYNIKLFEGEAAYEKYIHELEAKVVSFDSDDFEVANSTAPKNKYLDYVNEGGVVTKLPVVANEKDQEKLKNLSNVAAVTKQNFTDFYRNWHEYSPKFAKLFSLIQEIDKQDARTGDGVLYKHVIYTSSDCLLELAIVMRKFPTLFHLLKIRSEDKALTAEEEEAMKEELGSKKSRRGGGGGGNKKHVYTVQEGETHHYYKNFLILSSEMEKKLKAFSSLNINGKTQNVIRYIDDDNGAYPKANDALSLANFTTAISTFFNDERNRYGKYCRFLLLDRGFAEGLSVKDARYFHFLEVPEDRSQAVQPMGRVTRFCGSKNLPFADESEDESGWKVFVFVLFGVIGGTKKDQQQRVYDLLRLSDQQHKFKLISAIQQATQEGAVDYRLYKNINFYDKQKSASVVDEIIEYFDIP